MVHLVDNARSVDDYVHKMSVNIQQHLDALAARTGVLHSFTYNHRSFRSQ